MDINKIIEDLQNGLYEAGLVTDHAVQYRRYKDGSACFTIMICPIVSYKDIIDRQNSIIKMVEGYEDWSESQKKTTLSDLQMVIDNTITLEKTYGSRENELSEKKMAIENSEAWRKFMEQVGDSDYEIVEDTSCYHIFYYL